MKIFDKQTRIEMATKTFNLLFGNVTERKFGYLWAKKGDDTKATYPFTVSNSDERAQMAIKAIELNDAGFDVYYGVNLGNEPPKGNNRFTAGQVTLQTAVVTDIDIEGGNHTSNEQKKYPPTFDVAKTFLPFETSITVNSGFGLHALCIYNVPIAITDENRKQAEERNKKFLDVIRSRAGVFSKAVDGVGDLPRILRVPGTYNYKCGRDNAPLCKLVDVTNIQFTAADMDSRLNALTPARAKSKQEGTAELIYQTSNSPEFNIWRAVKMLDVIPVAELKRDEWDNIGMALKNNGNSVSDWEQWSRNDVRFKPGECEKLWQGFNKPGLTIATICDIALKYGYDAKAVYDEWCKLHPENKPRVVHRPEPTNDDGEEKFAMTQDKIKNCPANLRIPNNFIFSKNGIYQIVETKKETKYLLVTQTPIVPTKIFFEPSKGTDEYEVAILSRNKWRYVEVDAKTLGDARALNMLCDYGALIIDNLKLKNFFAAIIALNPDMTEVKAYNKTGWTNDDCTEFIYPHERAPYIIRRNGFDFNKIFKPKGDPELWKQKFTELTEKGGTVACTYFGFALSAPLAKPIIGANPSAHLFGKSGGGKTALLKFIASTFGNPRELIRNFAATNKNRLLVAAVFDGLPTFFDELETIQGKTAEEALSTDVYNFCDGKGNQANKRDGTAREIFNFRASRLTTGERQILKQHDLRGAFKRLLPLGMKTSNRLPDELATDLHFFSESNFGHFGKIWTDFVATHLEDIKREYEFFAKFYAPQKKYEPTHLKFLSAAVVSFEYFTVAIGLKSEFDKCACVRIMRAIVDTLPTTEELDDTKRAIEALGSYVAAHEKSFTRDEKDNATSKPIEIGAWGTTCSGKIFDTGEVAFHPTELKRILEDELKFASADKLIAEWNEQGNLLFSDKGRTTHLIRIGSKVYRTVHFRANVISTDIDSAEEKYYEELENS